MIPRYSSSEIAKIWSLENKFNIWTKIECLIVKKLAIDGIIPKDSANDIINKAKFTVQEIEEIEKETKHDVLAYIKCVSNYIGENSKYFHHGVTSSDIIDTSFSIQLKQSANIIIKKIENLLIIIKNIAQDHKYTLMIGRSHGVHAEPITFGIKLASFYCEFKRNLERMKLAKNEISVCAISGPVGTYNSISPSVEEFVANKLDLKAEKVSTQVIPRDRHAVFFSTLGIIASSIERIAVEIRNLQRTEILEVEEFFDKEQKGSSSMPHKRNPILSENLTGLARYVRSAVIPSMENIVLWHERDISHSSVERIFAPDITSVIDFALSRLSILLKNLVIHPNNMKKNIEKLGGLHKSQDILLALIQKGLSREKAYDLVQVSAKRSWNNSVDFIEILKKNSNFNEYLDSQEIKKIMSSNNDIKNIDKIFKSAFDK